MRYFILSMLVLSGIVGCTKSNFKGEAQQGQAKPPEKKPPGEPVNNENIVPVDEPEGLFKECEKAPSSKFVAKLYRLPEGTPNLPDFASLSSIKEICLNQLDIKPRRFEDGFPGVDNLIEWFALDIHFDLTIAEEGDYSFRLNSDDGSILYADGQVVINNDGLHDVGSKDGTVHLKPGLHHFNVGYYQGPRFNIALELYWKKPGASGESYLPLDIVSRPAP